MSKSKPSILFISLALLVLGFGLSIWYFFPDRGMVLSSNDFLYWEKMNLPASQVKKESAVSYSNIRLCLTEREPQSLFRFFSNHYFADDYERIYWIDHTIHSPQITIPQRLRWDFPGLSLWSEPDGQVTSGKAILKDNSFFLTANWGIYGFFHKQAFPKGQYIPVILPEGVGIEDLPSAKNSLVIELTQRPVPWPAHFDDFREAYLEGALGSGHQYIKGKGYEAILSVDSNQLSTTKVTFLILSPVSAQDPFWTNNRILGLDGKTIPVYSEKDQKELMAKYPETGKKIRFKSTPWPRQSDWEIQKDVLTIHSLGSRDKNGNGRILILGVMDSGSELSVYPIPLMSKEGELSTVQF